jgi:tripartite ATP-independent transporter DctM subunit
MSFAFAALIAIFVAAFVLRMPIGYGMISAGIVYLLVAGESLSSVGQLMMGGFNSKFVLLAVPLFIFAAQIMNSSTVTERIFSFAFGLVGRFRGGLAQMNVVNSVIFSGMSGSAVADTGGVGVMSVKAMTDKGYEKGFSCAVTAASSTIGPIIPPSIPMVIYASLTGTSVGLLFAGGIVPGILLALMQMALISVLAWRRGFPRDPWIGFTLLLTQFFRAGPALLVPVILLGGIYSGVFTPTEAAAVAASYALILAFVVYRSISPSEFVSVLRLVGKQISAVSLMIGGAFIINYAVAVEGIPRAVADALLSITDDGLMLFLIINLLFLVMGMFLDTIVLLLIMVPITFPIMVAAGVDPIHFGVVIVLNMMIGLSTPPFGVNLFIISQMTQTPLRDVVREIWPFIGIMILTLVILILVPDIALAVPRLIGYVG